MDTVSSLTASALSSAARRSHLENAIVSFMLFKVVSKSMEAAADRVAGVLGDQLVEEEERSKVRVVVCV